MRHPSSADSARLILSLLVGALVSCSADEPPAAPAPDAAVQVDAGVGRDAGATEPDAGAPADSGVEVDAGVVPELVVLEDGVVDPLWGGREGLSAFDSESEPPYGDCTDEAAGTETCPSIDWQVVTDPERGDVLEVSHPAEAGHAGLVVGPAAPVDLSEFAQGRLTFDIRVVSSGGFDGFFVKVESGGGRTSGERPVSGVEATGEWETVSIPVSTLIASGELDLAAVTVPMVFFPAFGTAPNLTYQLDDVRFTGGTSGGPTPTDYVLTAHGAGTVSDRFNPAGYGCVVDFGFWIHSAGVVEPGVDSCDPIGTPRPLSPHVVGAAAQRPLQAHRWWGSVPFLGEMTIGDPNKAAYITPDPLTARLSNRGARVMGIPAGLRLTGDGFLYPVPDPFAEVFDGVAIANLDYGEMDAYLADHSDGSVTVEWRQGGEAVMEATFVHGSPYAYFKAYRGRLAVRTLRPDGGEKGTFYRRNDSLGVWTNVAGQHNSFLITGEGQTTFSNVEGTEIWVSNAANELTLTLLPAAGGPPSDSVSAAFEAHARSVVRAVDIDYSVDRSDNSVTVTHTYRDVSDQPIQTMAGLHPLHWKNGPRVSTPHTMRSARGIIEFRPANQFSYTLPFVGVLPYLPSNVGSTDWTPLEVLVREFVSAGSETWNQKSDTYWAGKDYGKVAELAAIARSIGMTAEADQLIAWLKSELEDWFTATTDGALDTKKYFVYDDEWDTLLGVEESFGAHQQLNDHHFHYGYFVRAAAEICRVEPAWCGADRYGPMVELLIRDYAGGRDDPEFPYLRHFDPANGFSWASGMVNFALGNNNESTSEAATAYGAMVLYGLITGKQNLVERGMYLHASTSATYWEYWNNLDGHRGRPAEFDNFLPGYETITTSIIWGKGAVFATWFSGARAHILGIQGLPTNPLILHVGLHADYMADYVALGLSESSNRKPSGLLDDQWRDIWWNLWAMVDADASIADYQTVGTNYDVEAGETKAHTFHWLHSLQTLGRLATGTGALTADHPAALAFDKGSTRYYVVYNFTGQSRNVTFSDGHVVIANTRGFNVGQRR